MKGQRMFRRLTPSELGAWLQARPNALLLDTRDAASHARNGWPGALRLSQDTQDELLLRTDRRRPVLIYCHHGIQSQVWAQMFADFGFTDVCDVIGGHAAWHRDDGATQPAITEAGAPGTR
jgi:rhodanese-related sulfurtransferase